MMGKGFERLPFSRLTYSSRLPHRVPQPERPVDGVSYRAFFGDRGSDARPCPHALIELDEAFDLRQPGRYTVAATRQVFSPNAPDEIISVDSNSWPFTIVP
jgi:hypothetical protein